MAYLWLLTAKMKMQLIIATWTLLYNGNMRAVFAHTRQQPGSFSVPAQCRVGFGMRMLRTRFFQQLLLEICRRLFTFRARVSPAVSHSHQDCRCGCSPPWSSLLASIWSYTTVHLIYTSLRSFIILSKRHTTDDANNWNVVADSFSPIFSQSA